VSFVVDTNILIYHAAGSAIAHEFLAGLIAAGTFNISIITKIEFLGWHAQTLEGFKKCGRLVGLSSVLAVTQEVADQAIALRRDRNVRLADAIIAATAIVNGFNLATRNIDDFKGLGALEIVNPFQ